MSYCGCDMGIDCTGHPPVSPPETTAPTATDMTAHSASIAVALVRCIHGAIKNGEITPSLRHQVTRLAAKCEPETSAKLIRALDPTPIDSFAPRIVQSVSPVASSATPTPRLTPLIDEIGAAAVLDRQAKMIAAAHDALRKICDAYAAATTDTGCLRAFAEMYRIADDALRSLTTEPR